MGYCLLKPKVVTGWYNAIVFEPRLWGVSRPKSSLPGEVSAVLTPTHATSSYSSLTSFL